MFRRINPGTNQPVWASVALGVALLSACSDFYTAEVAGFIKQERSPNANLPPPGVNGVEVRVYLRMPNSFDSADFVAHTTTGTNRSVIGTTLDGYFSHSLAWESSSSDYGSDGDLRRIWIATSHPDYEEAIVPFDGILSDSINVLPDTLLQSHKWGPNSVVGQVIDNGVGINGVRVELLFNDATAHGQAVRTQTFDRRDGVYVFDDVKWPVELGDELEAKIVVEDGAYIGEVATSVTLQADQDVDVLDRLRVSSSRFSLPELRGKVVDESGRGVNGVRLAASLQDGDATRWATISGDPGGAPGTFRFRELAWDLPGDTSLEAARGTWTLSVEVDDTQYEQVSDGGKPVEVPVARDLAATLADDIIVTRTRRGSFTATLVGRCVERVTTVDGEVLLLPIGGVSVAVSYDDDNGTHRLATGTDADGEYAVLLNWSNDAPSGGPSAGEDLLHATLSFESPGELQFQDLHVQVPSWLDPARAPDATGMRP